MLNSSELQRVHAKTASMYPTRCRRSPANCCDVKTATTNGVDVVPPVAATRPGRRLRLAFLAIQSSRTPRRQRYLFGWNHRSNGGIVMLATMKGRAKNPRHASFTSLRIDDLCSKVVGMNRSVCCFQQLIVEPIECFSQCFQQSRADTKFLLIQPMT